VNELWPQPQDWISALYIILPTYCTNGAPVIFGGGQSIDLGKTLPDGQRILGDHKTFRGFISGIAVGTLVGVLCSYIFSANLMLIALPASLGALLGDMAGAFLKRRLHIRPGGALPVVDQLDFVVGSMLLVSLFSPISVVVALILLVVTPPIHFLTNVGAYLLGLKENYW
jgi:CDP-2,3-bis-(O-geranylgeranyl)-sn-glycerol synthase